MSCKLAIFAGQNVWQLQLNAVKPITLRSAQQRMTGAAIIRLVTA